MYYDHAFLRSLADVLSTGNPRLSAFLALIPPGLCPRSTVHVTKDESLPRVLGLEIRLLRGRVNSHSQATQAQLSLGTNPQREPGNILENHADI